MVVDQVNHKTCDVVAELYKHKLVVHLSKSAARELDGIMKYVVPLEGDPVELLEIDAALATIFSKVGRYERRFQTE